MLFTFPSRYLFTIGQSVVFSLAGWSPRIPTGLLVSCGTRVPLELVDRFNYRAVTVYGRPFHAVHLHQLIHIAVPRPLKTCVLRFRLFPFRSPLLRESRFLSVPPGTKMFQFPGLATHLRGFGAFAPRVSPFGNLRIIAC